MARKTIARANGRDAPVNNVIERSRVRDPDRAIPAGQNAYYCIFPQSFHGGKGDDPRIAKAVDTIRSRSPYNSLSVFKESCYRIAGQAICSSIVLHNIPADAEDTVAHAGNPKIAITIENHVVDRQFTSIEIGAHEGPKDSVAQFSKSQSWSCCSYAHPERSVGPRARLFTPMSPALDFSPSTG